MELTPDESGGKLHLFVSGVGFYGVLPQLPGPRKGEREDIVGRNREVVAV